MRPPEFSADTIIALLRKQTIASLPEVMTALGTRARRTAFRKLKDLAARTSYSHRGRYYTLDELADFDERGLWAFGGVRFSRAGTLIATAESFVNQAQAEHFGEDLDNLLHVGAQDALRKLVRDGRLTRHKLAGQFLYCAADRTQARQLRARRLLLTTPGLVRPLPDAELMPAELRAAIVLFASLLSRFIPARPRGMTSPYGEEPDRQGDRRHLLRLPELVGRLVLVNQAAASQSGSLARATDRGHRLPVDLLEDRSLCRRRLRPGADRLGDRDDGIRGQRDVSPHPGGRPSGRDQLAGLTPLLPCPLGRGGPGRFDVAGRGTILMMRGFRRANPVQHRSALAPAPTRRAASPGRATPAARAARRRWQPRGRAPRASASGACPAGRSR